MHAAIGTVPAQPAGRFQNFRILTKVLVGFGSVLAILAIVALVGFLGLSRIGLDLTHYVAAVELYGDAADAERDLLLLRGHVDRYVRTGDKAEIDAVHALEESVGALIAKGISVAESEAERNNLTAMREKLGVIVTDFKTATELNLAREKLANDTLAIAGPKLTADLEAIMHKAMASGNGDAAMTAGDALRDAFTARLYVNLMLDRHEAAAAEQVAASLRSLQQGLTKLESASGNSAFKQEIDEAKALAPAYEAAFQSGHKLDQQIEQLIHQDVARASEEMIVSAEQTKSEAAAAEHHIADEIIAIVKISEWTAIGFSLGGFALGITLAWLIGRGISNPIVLLCKAMRRLSQGERDVAIAGTNRRDEVGEMATALLVFKDNLIETERLRLANEAAKHQAEADRKQAMLQLADRFESSVGTVVSSVTVAAEELQGTAQMLSSAAEETAQQSNAVSAAAAEMTQNVETVASATEELNASVHEIGNQVVESNRIVHQAVGEAEVSNAQVRALTDAAHKIGAVVTLISEIASQTNLLALNATIEAARAGDAGRGFAVVASEVKTLATQTASATEDIGAQIRTIQESTESSAVAMQSINKTIGRVSEISAAIASAVEEQSAATQEISRNVQQAAAGTGEVTSNIVGVSQASQQTSAASAQLLSAANDLSRNGAALRHEVDGFLRAVRGM